MAKSWAMQVWYCVSPKDRVKFENMAKGLFPELYNICPAFLRHKDILLSPKTLRNHHIEYVQVCCRLPTMQDPSMHMCEWFGV